MSVNNFCYSILDIETAVRWHYAIIEMLATFMGKNGMDDIATTS